jgi:diadenosine tetraphosphate (Ap4A) HIT family hydrolase
VTSVFTRIINGESPGRFVYQDDEVVAFLTIAPINPGHTLVVPRREIDLWIDLPPELTARLFQAAQHVARAIQRAFRPRRVAALVVGLEVPHVHVHLVPFNSEAELRFDRADHGVAPSELDEVARRITSAFADAER